MIPFYYQLLVGAATSMCRPMNRWPLRKHYAFFFLLKKHFAFSKRPNRELEFSCEPCTENKAACASSAKANRLVMLSQVVIFHYYSNKKNYPQIIQGLFVRRLNAKRKHSNLLNK